MIIPPLIPGSEWIASMYKYMLNGHPSSLTFTASWPNYTLVKAYKAARFD